MMKKTDAGETKEGHFYWLFRESKILTIAIGKWNTGQFFALKTIPMAN